MNPDDDVLQYVRRVDVSQVHHVRADLHPDVHDGRHRAGVDAVRLPDRRLGDQLHHAAQPVHGYHAGIHEEHRAQGRHGHADLDDAAV